MKAVKVEYTVKPEYVSTNKANIQKVMDELRALGDVGIMYSTYVKEDGCSFVHFAMQRNAESTAVLTSLETFKAFNTQLKAEGLTAPPHSVKLDLVAGSFDM
jgi:hypothetical protein